MLQPRSNYFGRIPGKVAPWNSISTAAARLNRVALSNNKPLQFCILVRSFQLPLLLPEINLNGYARKIEIFAYFIFDVAPVRGFNILRKICKQRKGRGN